MKNLEYYLLTSLYADGDESTYAVKKDNFERMELHNCYGSYGEQYSSEDAGDYSLMNELSTAHKECLKTLKRHFNLPQGDYVIKHYGGDEFHLELGDEWEDWEYLYIPEEVMKEISEFLSLWEEANSLYTQVLAYNYWNGNNWQSIIIEADDGSDWAITHGTIEDNEIAEVISNENEWETIDNSRGRRIYKYGDYLIVWSQALTFFDYEIMPFDSWKSGSLRGIDENAESIMLAKTNINDR